MSSPVRYALILVAAAVTAACSTPIVASDAPPTDLDCTSDAVCDDGNTCNGAEVCSTSRHVCVSGAPLADATTCRTAEGADGVCRAGLCLPLGCNNGVLEAGETCDDGNDDPTDGCTPDCAYSCTEDADCQDASVCNGSESCDVGSHTCEAGSDLVCDDPNVCVADSCDAVLGCVTNLIDADGDHHASDALGTCGDDCDDTRDDVFTGAAELCDGLDNDCNGTADDTAPTWYIDCDADGFATTTEGARTGCTMPDAGAAGCSPGGWTTIRPVDAATTDCAESDAAIHPTAEELPGDLVDQNCDGVELCFLDEDDDGFRRADEATISSADLDCSDDNESPATDPSTDCCDTDARARPDQTTSFTSQRVVCGGYDYDCDGTDTLADTRRGSCYCPAAGSNSTYFYTALTVGWVGSPPACGATARYWNSSSCPSMVLPAVGWCPAGGGDVVQACR